MELLDWSHAGFNLRHAGSSVSRQVQNGSFSAKTIRCA